MKILFINPQRTRISHDPLRTGTPLGLLSLASMVNKHLPNIQIYFIDAVVEGDSEDEIKQGVFRCGLTRNELKIKIRKIDPDVVAISSIFTSEWINASFCAEIAKSVNQDIKVIMGGHHATFEPEFMINHGLADFIIIGEGEYPFLELITFLNNNQDFRELKKIKGIAYKGLNGIIINPPGKVAQNLDELEDPAFELLNPRLYKLKYSHSGKIIDGCNSLIDFSISRGCPINCAFCTSSRMWGPRLRTFSINRVKQQIKKIREIGFDHTSIEDDQVLMINKNICYTMFEELKKQDFKWNIDSGIYYPLITEEFVKIASMNGCYRIFLPIEHPAIEIMHNEHKYLSVTSQEMVKEKIKRATDILRHGNIDFYVAIMIGFKDETKQTLDIINQLAHFVKSQGASWVSFFYPKPLPGTRDYINYPSVLLERKWQTNPEYWAFSTPVLKPDAISIADLENHVNTISFELNGYANLLVNSSQN